MTRKILVCPYQPVWVQQFESEAGVLWGIFGSEATAIHHIGSTSIPGMSAKPTIDLLVEVRDISGVDRFNEKLGESGYTPKGENGIPGRRYFFKESQDLHVCHVHCFQSGDGQIERHLNFRDYLMAHPREARSYSQLKEILADQFPEDIDSYCEGKDRFIQEIGNYSGYRGNNPNLRCLRVRSTRKHLKFGDFPLMAKQLRKLIVRPASGEKA